MSGINERIVEMAEDLRAGKPSKNAIARAELMHHLIQQANDKSVLPADFQASLNDVISGLNSQSQPARSKIASFFHKLVVSLVASPSEAAEWSQSKTNNGVPLFQSQRSTRIALILKHENPEIIRDLLTENTDYLLKAAKTHLPKAELPADAETDHAAGAGAGRESTRMSTPLLDAAAAETDTRTLELPESDSDDDKSPRSPTAV